MSTEEDRMKYRATTYQAMMAAIAAALLFILAACSGGTGNTNTQSSQNGTVNMVVSDASTEDWAMIGVKVLSISLTPQGGGAPVSAYTASSPVPITNLVLLDQLGDILGAVTVPAGTYTGATLTISANPGDVVLTASADPEPGFAGTPGATIPSNQIQIMGAQGNTGSLTVPVKINFSSPLTVSTGQSSVLDVEFNLAHPAFIVAHVPPSGTTLWAVNFNGPVRHRPMADITRLILRHMYGQVSSVSSDNSTLTMTREFPTEPAVTPETAVASSQSLQVKADSVNGTLFYDLDTKTVSTIKDFSTVNSTIINRFVRVAARYQTDGSLVAVRIWSSSTFNSVWLSPEGHVLHVDSTNNIITVQNEDGAGIPITVNSSTEFFFRTPEKALADTTPIATGTAFLSGGTFVRGFKVHVNVVDPLASPLVAQTVDIEIARFDGAISSPNNTSFIYTHDFRTSTDNYTVNMDYVSVTSGNGSDPSGNPIQGFVWWDFAFPTLLNFGSNAIPNFVSATNGSVNFGGTTPAIPVFGLSNATWNDPANPNGWAARFAVLLPSPIPRGTVARSWAATAGSGNFGMIIPGGTNTVTVNVSSTPGSATLVYQVDDTNGIITVSPQDITTSSGMANMSANLVSGAPVKVFGVPQSDGSIKAYVLLYMTGSPSIQ